MTPALPAQFLLFCCLLASPMSAATTPDVLYPPGSGVIDVKEHYGAKGDGMADDSAALQKAIDENVGQFRIIYLPAGIYRITRGLTFGADIAKAKQTIIQGQQRDKTIIRLADKAEGFGDPAKPRIVLSYYNGESTGQAFCNALCDVTIDTGSGNPGASGVRFMAHNQGTMRDVRIRSGDGSGFRGLDLDERWPGPFFVQRVEIIGFDIGIDIGQYDYSQCYEDITLSKQRVVGIRNDQNKVAIRRLKSTNSVPAIEQVGDGGFITLLDSTLDGGSKERPAIVNKGRVVLRRVSCGGYGSVLDAPSVAGPLVTDFDSHGIKSLFSDPVTGRGKPLDLPIQDAPQIPSDDPAQWVLTEGFDSAAIQAAIDRAAKEKRGTVFIKPGQYAINASIRVHGSVRRITGALPELHAVEPLVKSADAVFVVEDSTVPAVLFDRFWGTPWARDLPYFHIENRSLKTAVVLRNLNLCSGGAYRTGPAGAGPLFIEDVCSSYFEFARGQQVWARQINPENHHPLMTCDNATVWLMDLKTEGLQTVIRATNGSKVELYGGYIFPIHAGAPQFPAFEITDSQFYVNYCEGIISGNSSAYTVHVTETRKGVTRVLTREQTDRLGDGTRMTSFSTVADTSPAKPTEQKK